MEEKNEAKKNDFSSLFTSKKTAVTPAESSVKIKETEEIIKDTIRRLRVVEERYTNLRKNIQINEQNTINEIKKIKNNLKSTNEDVKDLKHNMRDFGDELKHVIKELGSTAKRDEVKVIDRYLSFLDPLNFLSKREIEKLVDEKVEERIAHLKKMNNLEE